MPRVHRIEVGVRPGLPDPRSDAVVRGAGSLGVPLRSARARRVYLVQGDFSGPQVEAVRARLLADPVTESGELGAAAIEPGCSIVEVHPLPGVMDPAAQSVRQAIADLVPGIEVQVSTGWRYDLGGVEPAAAGDLARRMLANTVVQAVHERPFVPESLPRGTDYTLNVRRLAIRDLSDGELMKLSREAHLFLSLAEMKAVQAEYRTLGRDPTDIEIETIAQTWSEHCVHKTLKSRIVYRSDGTEGQSDGATKRRSEETRKVPERGMFEIHLGAPRGGDSAPRPLASAPSGGRSDASSLPADPIDWTNRPGHTVNPDGSVTIDNLLKSTVAAATHELIAGGIDWALSVFKDNSGVIALDENWGVCIKVETHNHPSAIEPYGGAATGIGGCIRDVMGTGLGAKPIASTDVFCVATPGSWDQGSASERPLPPGTLHPRRVLENVVAGVRDYGNRMGIPTVSGAVTFDDRYIGNPLVFCGCIGVIPRSKVKGAARAGDRIIALGGRTGRDGIHGATFSSAELEHTAADEFGHAVQIGNAIEEKRVLDAILRARDEDPRGPLFSGLTDCGAGGFSSAVGEMGGTIGAEVHLDRAPLKYSGLSHAEIWISEAQERMVLAVPPQNLARLKAICAEEHVEVADLGHFGTEGAELRLLYNGTTVGSLPMHFLHEGIPTPTRVAKWSHSPLIPSSPHRITSSPPQLSTSSCLLALLSHPDIASKHWIIRQYDHEVQGATVLKPLVGPGSRGPGDASVLEPIAGTGRGIAISQGLQTGIGDPAIGGDPYLMTLAAIDECVRNLVCVGADPSRIAILDNFCWPSCEKPENLGGLVRAAEACYDGAKAYKTPFVSGKDSLNNQLKIEDPATGQVRVIEIPPTLLVTGMGIVPSVARCVTMDAKQSGNTLLLIGETKPAMGGSCYQRLFGLPPEPEGASPGSSLVPVTDLDAGPRTARAVAELIRQSLLLACHDCSDGGLLVAVAEMLTASGTAQPVSIPSGKGAGGAMDLAAILRAAPARSGPPANATGTPPLGIDMTLESGTLEAHEQAFSETPSRYVVEVRKSDVARIRQVLSDYGGIFSATLGTLAPHGRLVWPGMDVDVPVDDLARAWLAPLDW